MGFVASFPVRRGRTGHDLPVRATQHPRQLVLDVLAQPLVADQLGGLGTPSAPLGMTRDRRFVVEPVGTCRGVGAQLTRDSRRCTAQPPRDAAHSGTRSAPQRDVFALIRGEVATRNSLWQPWIHAASLTEPAEPDRRRYARFSGSVLGHHPGSDRRPKPNPFLPEHVPSRVECG